MTLGMPILEAEGLKAYYIVSAYGVKRTVRAVDNIFLSIKEGEVLGIAGESGSGKSTLVKALLGLTWPPLTITGGTVRYRVAGQQFEIRSDKGARDRGIGWDTVAYIPQGSMSVLNPVRRIKDTFRDLVYKHTGLPANEFEKAVEAHLEVFGLPKEVLHAFPHQLSGGMRQRVTIALATILKPKVIFADEPTTALDVVVQRGVIHLLRRVQRDGNAAMVLVTHDMAVHAQLADRIAIMYAGKVIEEGSVGDVFRNPLHPYTEYLIRSVPQIGDRSPRIGLGGAPPRLDSLPRGCSFHERCPHARPICREGVPALVGVGNGHKVACFLHSEV
ncbi:MAG: ABC transporter ATP-binding protein [Bacillota bacterium]